MDWPVCKLQACNLGLNKFAPAEQQRVNKHQKLDANFDIRCQLEHFDYDMNRTLVPYVGTFCINGMWKQLKKSNGHGKH